jgi:hypothetical protein
MVSITGRDDLGVEGVLSGAWVSTQAESARAAAAVRLRMRFIEEIPELGEEVGSGRSRTLSQARGFTRVIKRE